MSEREWVSSVISNIESEMRNFDDNIRVVESRKLPYSYEVKEYNSDGQPLMDNLIRYETDILLYEVLTETTWKPRVIIEAKIKKVTTHDAITYSQKAQTHKNVHPYLRYGIMIGDRSRFPLPGRLFRHGHHFDFMLSWKSLIADKEEWKCLIEILRSEYFASKFLEEMIFNSRSKNREHYTVLHKTLVLK